MHWLDLEFFIKKENLAIREFAFFSLMAAFDEFFFWLLKKGRQKICMRTEKN